MFAEEFIHATLKSLASNKKLAERAVEQLPDEQLRASLDEHTNSIAVIMKHIAGNLISRWTDFLTTDGEKPDRGRDNEFVDSFRDRTELLAYWDQGWNCCTASIESLQSGDLDKTVTIRGELHTVPYAIQRSLGHTCYHVGQIIQLARHLAGDDWVTLTIPKGQSEQFTKERWGKPSG